MASAANSQTRHLLNGKTKNEIYKSGAHHRVNNNLDSALYYADQLISYEQKYGRNSDLIVAYYHKLNKLNFFNRTAEGFALAITTYEKFCTESYDAENCANCDAIYEHLANYHAIMQDYQQGIKYLDQMCNKGHMYYYKKAKMYVSMNLPDSATLTTSHYISLTEKDVTTNERIHAYNDHGLILQKLGRFNEAITAFSSAFATAQTSGYNLDNYGYVEGNMGACYYELGNLDKAYYYLQIDSYKSLRQKSAMNSYLSAEMTLAEIDNNRKDYIKSIDRLENLTNNYDHHLSPDQQLELLKLYMHNYKGLGDIVNYERYLYEWIALNESNAQNVVESNREMIEYTTRNSLRQATLQMETEKALINQKLISKERENDKKQLKNWLLVSSLISIILIILFSFWRYRKRAILKETQLKLDQKEQDFLKLKVQEERRNVQELTHELLFKQNFTTRLVNKLDQLETVSNPELKNIELFIQNELDVKSVRAQLQNQMGELSSNFYNALKIRHPKLNDTDMMLAAMIVMNMSNKEISISKNMSTDSIKTTKNRLKKKLDIPISENLDDYLKGLTKP